jgi:peroxiredoxin
VIKSYGLYNEEKGTSYRAVVIVDKEGTIRFKRTYKTVVSPGPTGQGVVQSDLDPADILAEVDKIQLSS